MTAQAAAIPHLAAAFAIEGRGIQHKLNGITGTRCLGRFTVDHQRHHAAGVLQSLIALKSGGLQLSRHLLNRPLQGEVNAHCRGLGSLTLGLHGRLKTGQINA